MHPVIWDLPLPKVGMEELLKVEGVDIRYRPRPEIQELHQRALTEAEGLITPKVIWTEIEIEKAEGQELILKGGHKLTSKLLAKMAGTADKLVLFAVTIGHEIEERIAVYQSERKILLAYLLDAAASAYVALAGSASLNKLENLYKKDGYKTTFPMGPGHSYWKDLNDQRVIFDLLKPEEIGLELNESNLMIPRKSLSMVIGIGHNLIEPKGKTHCDYCSFKKNCLINGILK